MYSVKVGRVLQACTFRVITLAPISRVLKKQIVAWGVAYLLALCRFALLLCVWGCVSSMGASKKPQQHKRGASTDATATATATLLAKAGPQEEAQARPTKRPRADECLLQCECCERTPQQACSRCCCYGNHNEARSARLSRNPALMSK